MFMFDAMMFIVPIISILIIILTFVMMFSTKARAKMMAKQIKATRYMMDEVKDDIRSISTDMADATKGGIETSTRAIKKGLTEDIHIYCKHCGSAIDSDSRFCKSCGKKIK